MTVFGKQVDAQSVQTAAVVKVDANGGLQFNGEQITFVDLINRMSASVAVSDTVTIVAAPGAPFREIVRATDVARQAGIARVGLLKSSDGASVEETPVPVDAPVLSIDRSGTVRLDARKLKLSGVSSTLRKTLARRQDRAVFVRAYDSLAFDAIAPVIDAAKAAGTSRVGLLRSNR